MRAVIQRVTEASVRVDEEIIGRIQKGYVVLLGVEENDTEADADYIANKITGLRIFEDSEGKLNLDIAEAGGEILLVSQFTLYGDARKGRRPSFIRAAREESATKRLAEVREKLTKAGLAVSEGSFGAHMMVQLVNDGPVTILLDSRKEF